MSWRSSGDRDGFLKDPNAVEIRGESFTYPADITEDRDGEALKQAIEIGRTITREQLAGVLGLDLKVGTVLPDEQPKT
jgi:hypothetical protein